MKALFFENSFLLTKLKKTKSLITPKICLSILIGLLYSMSLVVYCIDPILMWTFGDRVDFHSRYSIAFYLSAAFVTFVLFHVPLFVIADDKLETLLRRISLKAIWSAWPGVIVIIFAIGQILERLGYRIGFAGFIIFLTTMWFLPLYVILLSPTQTRMFMNVVMANTSLSKKKSLIVAVSLIALPFLGVSIIKYLFYLLG